MTIIDNKGLEPVGGNILVKGVERKVTKGGLYLPTKDVKNGTTPIKKNDETIYERNFYIVSLGDNIAEEVKQKIKAGDRVCISSYAITSNIVEAEDDKEEYRFWFFCAPSDIKGRYVAIDNSVGQGV